jgi:hypothetical protein
MSRATTAIALVLLGSPLLMAWYWAAHRHDDQDDRQRQGTGGHSYGGGHSVFYSTRGATFWGGRGQPAVGSTVRGGFGGTGARAAGG